ncbi:polysaccharide biosynthesis protein [Roseinatronobacter alkalisoli]|uniref:Nucleoside-diphosphate sugar epimerase/dehydratase n=1 Tax=Roseinatronobacter alkalisoli TaxID=3028235 RepID=A0ABT5TCV7_9RHOB|nr:nucleoside-diphosphate sugar epimerase/dehydratase [Roseinatronobacter sp. HJB301]MDD7971972.1 nucleoside-diphosphate sugar epimerase/dehydratase [Roseinatronobacter sp. HJB301]
MTFILDRLIRINRPFKRALQVFADSALIGLCFATAMMLRLESVVFVSDPQVWLVLVPVLPLTIFVFARLGLYRSIVRYITGRALRSIAIGVFFSAVILFLVALMSSAPIPRSVPGIYAILLFLVVGGVRFLMRIALRQSSGNARKPVAIYGAGESGRQLQNALDQTREYTALAFIDDDPELQRSLVAGRRVFSPEQAGLLVENLQIKAILLAIPSASRARRREIVAQLEPLGVEIKTIPGMTDIVSGVAKFSDLKQVTPEDLLGRDPVPSRPELMRQNIAGKVVLVSGAGGSIGSELCRQILKQNPAALVLLEVSEYALYAISMELRETLAREERSIPIDAVLGSVQNPGRVRAILRAFQVQTVYHAAAYKHVVLVEENVVEGIRNNVFGTKVIAEAAAEMGVENFILISTDKAVRPTNFMGASKRMAELVCQGLAQSQTRTTFSMVRFGNVLGSSGSVIPRFRAQIEAGGPVTVTHRDITRYFMTIPEASQLVIQAGAMARGGDVFVLDMGDPVKILDLAQSMVRLHGLKPYIIEETDQPETERGDIGVKIVGLNKGEKLYEELLIGDKPQGTDHPRIMSATEVSLPQDELNALLEQLQRACHSFDIATIRKIFLQAPLAYRPNGEAIYDLMWTASHRKRVVTLPKLTVIEGAKDDLQAKYSL